MSLFFLVIEIDLLLCNEKNFFLIKGKIIYKQHIYPLLK